MNRPALMGGPVRGSHCPRLPNNAAALMGAGSRQESPPSPGSWPPLGPETPLVLWTRFLDKNGGHGQT